METELVLSEILAQLTDLRSCLGGLVIFHMHAISRAGSLSRLNVIGLFMEIFVNGIFLTDFGLKTFF